MGSFFITAPITTKDARQITQEFDQVKRFWAKRYPPLVGIAATRLAILRGDQTFRCPEPGRRPEVVQASDVNGTNFCQTLGAVVITEGLYNYLAGEATNPRSLMEFFVDHEVKHAVQAAEGELYAGVDTTPAQEREADCGAGFSIEHLDPGSVRPIEAFMPHLPSDDPRHGTPAQRLYSFKVGVQGGSC